MTKLFVTGLFRSGTTFLARALNAHPNLSVASDPYFEFWKLVRNRWWQTNQQDFNAAQPLGDYFCADQAQVSRFWAEALTVQLNEAELLQLCQRIAVAAEPYSPKIGQRLPNLRAGSAAEVLEQLYDVIPQAYPTEALQCVGAKEVWTDEFAAPFLAQYGANGRVIHILRDPRAIIASNRKSSTGAYPVLFLVRQWRKSVALAIMNKALPGFLQLRYKDIVSDPQASFSAMCAHLGVPFHAAVTDGSKYLDGAGEPWRQNSSHGTSSTINKEYVERWRAVLPEDEIAIIEWLCGPEMDYLGYKRTQRTFPEQQLGRWRDDYPNIAEWIKPYDFNLTPSEIEREQQRAAGEPSLFLTPNVAAALT